MSETIFVQGEGGNVWEMDLPLRPDHAKRLAAGQLTQVADADGNPYAGDPVVQVDPDEGDTEGEGEDEQPPELKAFLAEPPPPAVVKKAPAKKAAPGTT